MLPASFQQFLSRTSVILALPAWAGFVYVLLSHCLSVGGDSSGVTIVGADIYIIAALLCGLLSTLCAFAAIDDFSDLSNWARLIFCALPFCGLIRSIDPFHIFPA